MKTESIKLNVDGIEREFTFKPVNWEHFPKIFTLATRFQNLKENEILSVMDEKTLSSLMEMELLMFKNSYPEMKEQDIKNIIMDNVFEIMGVLFTVNLVRK